MFILFVIIFCSWCSVEWCFADRAMFYGVFFSGLFVFSNKCSLRTHRSVGRYVYSPHHGRHPYYIVTKEYHLFSGVRAVLLLKNNCVTCVVLIS